MKGKMAKANAKKCLRVTTLCLHSSYLVAGDDDSQLDFSTRANAIRKSQKTRVIESKRSSHTSIKIFRIEV